MDAEQFRVHAEHEDEHWWFRGRRQVLRHLLRTATGSERRLKLLDVGCGTGGMAAYCADHYDVTGIEPSGPAIALARQRFPQVEFIDGCAPDDLGERMAEFDVVTLNDVLEHVYDDFTLASSILNSVRPGAIVLITVPHDRSLWSPHDIALEHFRRYETERLRDVWRGLPVEELLLSPFNSRLFPIVKAVRTVSSMSRLKVGDGGTDLKTPPAFINRTLESIFASERQRLAAALRAGTSTGVRYGVSLVAVLRRLEGECPVRTRPDEVNDDLHDPRVAA